MSNHDAEQTSSENAPTKRGRKVPNSQWAEMRTGYAAGIGLREMARKLGIPSGTVLARAKREGWTGQIRQAKVLGPRGTESDALNVTRSIALTMAERGQRHVERMADVADKVIPHVGTMEPGAILDRIEDIDRLDKVARRTYGLDDERHRAGLTVNIGLASMLPPPVA